MPKSKGNKGGGSKGSHGQNNRNNNNKSQPKQKDPDDIGGTNNTIAKGRNYHESKTKLRQLQSKQKSLSKVEQERIQTHLNHGTSNFYSERRMQRLKEDEEDPTSMDKLNPAQKRALLKRKRLNDNRTRSKLTRLESKRLEAAMDAADAEMLLHTEEGGFLEAENEMERTKNVTQEELKKMLPENNVKNIYDLTLTEAGPYEQFYDRSGRMSVLLGKSTGHVAVMDNHTMALKTEFNVKERCRTGTFLHNTNLFAIAQKNFVYIYDDQGIEIHEMKDHQDVTQLQYLPHHWLLASIGRTGYLQYHDTSTGDLVSKHRTRLGQCNVMTQNKNNAVIHCGHHNGVVTLWSPASNEYLVKMLCHKGSPIESIAIDKEGHRMVTAGTDGIMKIWDLRMFKSTHKYFVRGRAPRPMSMDISQTGILGIGAGKHAMFFTQEALKYKVQKDEWQYMRHSCYGGGQIESLRFRPFEDVCGLGVEKGFSSIVIPGSGEANLDSLEYGTNPYQDKKQRQESEVRALMDKLSPDMIALDPDVIGTIEESNDFVRRERLIQAEDEADPKKDADNEKKKREKNRMRGRNNIQAKLARKRKNVVDQNTILMKQAIEKEKRDKEKAKKESEEIESDAKADAPVALKRFFK